MNEAYIYGSEKEFFFDSWKNGICSSDIAKTLNSNPGTIFTILRDFDGMKPNVRRCASSHLTLSEREEIRVGLSARKSIRAITEPLNRSPSTISREVQRNRGRRYYKAVDANNRATEWPKGRSPAYWIRIWNSGS